ncbi:UNVERIFIED_CONTAM: hypothetical protein RMT77_003137 [Armadillidium vulgare]
MKVRLFQPFKHTTEIFLKICLKFLNHLRTLQTDQWQNSVSSSLMIPCGRGLKYLHELIQSRYNSTLLAYEIKKINTKSSSVVQIKNNFFEKQMHYLASAIILDLN